MPVVEKYAAGRVNRSVFWIQSILFLIFTVGGFWAAGMLYMSTRNALLAIAVNVVLQCVLTALWTCLMAKRFHDRGKTGKLALAYAVPSLALLATNALGLTGNQDASGFLDYILGGLLAVVSVWFVIELGFLRGTSGPNAYGSDPLAES